MENQTNIQPHTQPQKTTARDFFLNLGVIVALYTVAGSLISLLFTVINKAYPQITTYYSASSYSISFPVATIIIFFPIFILLSWIMGRDFVTQPEKKNLGIHKWLSYITLFVTGLAFAGDLVSVLYYFLNGEELTTGFLLKVLVVLVVTGLIFFYYITDVRRMLSGKEKMTWRTVATLLVVGAIVWGFAVLGSPRTQQLLKYDEQKVSDLQSISNAIQSYYYNKNALPNTLSDLTSGEVYDIIPIDKQTNQPYEYQKTNPTSFELCATFNKASTADNSGIYQNAPTYPVGSFGNINWAHPAGHACFSQTIQSNIMNQNSVYGVPAKTAPLQ